MQHHYLNELINDRRQQFAKVIVTLEEDDLLRKSMEHEELCLAAVVIKLDAAAKKAMLRPRKFRGEKLAPTCHHAEAGKLPAKPE
jgi:hypothetical protein